jgi:hypothetical protein
MNRAKMLPFADAASLAGFKPFQDSFAWRLAHEKTDT